MREEGNMWLRLRCDQCEALLADEYLERDRKRFCCGECARAFDRGDLKSISPHAHESTPAPVLTGAR
jgi:hypothetical protein